MARVTYENAHKSFGAVTAVRDLSLQVADGEFLVFVGPSGSGKTTALRMLAGLETVTSGRLLIDDRAVQNVRPQDRNIAMVFQDYALYPQMTVAANLAFGLKMRKVPTDEIKIRIERTAGMLDIGGLLDRKPAELSGGQRQRVALGRALVRDPQVFLMDEPLSNLDAKLRAQTRGEIKALQRTLGTTTIFVTHDQVEAMTMGDRIAVMKDGALEQVGIPDAVYDQPANVFVAGFIGSPAMTFVRCDLERDEGTVRLRAGSLAVTLPSIPAGLPSEVIVGVRPEHAQLWSGDRAELVGPIEGKVMFVEALGRETLVGVSTSDGSRFTALADGGYRVEVGETIRIGLVATGLHYFDPLTERALKGKADAA